MSLASESKKNRWLWVLLGVVIVGSFVATVVFSVMTFDQRAELRDQVARTERETLVRCKAQNATNHGLINLLEYLKSRQTSVPATLTPEQIEFFAKAEGFIPKTIPCK